MIIPWCSKVGVEAGDGRLLAAVLAGGAGEDAADLADQGPGTRARRSGRGSSASAAAHVAEPRRRAEDDGVGLAELVGLDHRDVGEGRPGPLCADLLEGLVGDQLGDLEQRDLGPGDLPGPFGDGLGHLVDMAISAVKDDVDLHAGGLLDMIDEVDGSPARVSDPPRPFHQGYESGIFRQVGTVRLRRHRSETEGSSMAESHADGGMATSHRVCPATRVFDLIAHKWTVTIIHHLHQADGPIRFRQLQRLVNPITQKELTKRLRELERSGLVERTIFAEVPPRVEYRLTDLGATLIPALAGLHQWAESFADVVDENRRRADETRPGPTAWRSSER